MGRLWIHSIVLSGSDERELRPPMKFTRKWLGKTLGRFGRYLHCCLSPIAGIQHRATKLAAPTLKPEQESF